MRTCDPHIQASQRGDAEPNILVLVSWLFVDVCVTAYLRGDVTRPLYPLIFQNNAGGEEPLALRRRSSAESKVRPTYDYRGIVFMDNHQSRTLPHSIHRSCNSP